MDINEMKEPWGESLFEEHRIVKEKYIKLIEYINSEEFFKLSSNVLKLLNNLKTLIEAYIKTISTRLFENIDTAYIADYSFLGLMLGMFNSSPFGSSSIPSILTDTKPTEVTLK